MEIAILDRAGYEAYEEFLHTHEHSLFYHSTKYKDFLEDLLECESRYLLAYEGNKIVGALPLMIKDGPFGKVVNSLPYYGSNGGIISHGNKEDIKLILREQLKSLDYASLTLISSPFFENTRDLLGIKPTDERISQISYLDAKNQDPQEYLLKLIDSSAVRNIKKAQRHGIEVREENEDALDFLYLTHKDNMNEIGGNAKTKEFFEKIPQYFEKGKDFKIYTAYLDRERISALLVFFYNRTVEYFTPVTVSEHRGLQPLSLILYHAIKEAMDDGYTFWNWGGTWLTQTGVYQFKKKWGAKDKIYSYYTEVKNKSFFDAEKSCMSNEYKGFYAYNFKRD